jgi:hypothetical protein
MLNRMTAIFALVTAALASAQVQVGSQKQLFLDDYIIESMEPGVYQLLNQPVKHPDNPLIRLGAEWERKGALSHGGDAGKVFFDDERGVYRFYGWMIDWGTDKRFLFYAESKDGIHWVKPKLGQVNYLGHDTNFISLPFTGEDPGNAAILKDPAAKNPREKYKMIYPKKENGESAMYPAYSADGITWSAYSVDKPAVPYWSDTNNNLLWDAKTQEYVLYLRTFNRMEKWFTPERVYPRDARSRTPAWATSKDFLSWDSPQDIREPDDRFLCFHTDQKDPIGSRDFYTLEVLPYEGGYVGFTSVYHNMFGLEPAGLDSGKARSPWMDRMDVQLVWSRDGKKFERVGDRRVFLPNGPEGSWDADLIYTVQAPIVREDLGEIWVYYEGFVGRHWFNQRGDKQEGQVGLAILRLDGFVSVTGRGSFTTKPMTFSGARLAINATGVDLYAGQNYGKVLVEVLDAGGQPIPGFTKEDCEPLGGDDLKHVVKWKGGSDLTALQGKPIKLRFHIDKAKLFSFQFVPKS